VVVRFPCVTCVDSDSCRTNPKNIRDVKGVTLHAFGILNKKRFQFPKSDTSLGDL
jgi:hypothetical protein